MLSFFSVQLLAKSFLLVHQVALDFYEYLNIVIVVNPEFSKILVNYAEFVALSYNLQ
jgi:hypothetical protein